MKSIVKIVSVVLILCGAALAQSGKPRIAFYFYGEEPKAGVFRPLGGEITKAIVKSGEYIAVDRTDAARQLITQEHQYQRHSGAVDEDQVSKFGKQWGVEYVISMEVAKSIDGFYIEAKMVDVEGAYIVKMGTVETPLESSKDVATAAERIIAELIGAAHDKSAPTAAQPHDAAPASAAAPAPARTYSDAPLKTRFGIAGGLGYRTFGVDLEGQSVDGGGFDYAFGVALQIPFTQVISLNPEVCFSGRTYSAEKVIYGTKVEAEVSEFAISVPMMLRATVNGMFYGEAGLHLAIPIGTQIKLKMEDVDYGEVFLNDESDMSDRSAMDFGLAFGGGAIFGNFSIGVRMTLSLMDMGNHQSNIIDYDYGDVYSMSTKVKSGFGIGAVIGVLF